MGLKIYQDKIRKQSQARCDEIRRDVDNELKRYMYVIAPNCQKGGASYKITHRTLVDNAGFDKEKLLDIDGKSYCKVYVINECVSDGKWSWDVKLSCKDYEDDGYVDWAEEFAPKK